MKLAHLCTVWILAALAATAAGEPVGGEPAFKIYVEHTGVYEVTFERLTEAGLDGPRPSAGIGVRNFGEPVPTWVEDGGDGELGPGDRVVFMGEVLRGTYSYLDPYSRLNCYRLSFDDPRPVRGSTRTPTVAAGEPDELWTKHHLESDRVMVRFRARQGEPEESWYWERLSVTDRQPFRQELIVTGLDRHRRPRGASVGFADALSESIRQDGGRPDAGGRIRSQLTSVFEVESTEPTVVRLRLGLRGWSEPRHRERNTLPHHDVEVRLDGSVVGHATWDGKDHFVWETEIPAHRIRDGANDLALSIPKRAYPASGDLVIDVVLVNWIELEYPHDGTVAAGQVRLFPAGAGSDHRIRLATDDGSPIELYDGTGDRWRSDDGRLATRVVVGAGGLSALKPGAKAMPSEVVRDTPAALRDPGRQVDYIMIAHRSLLAGARRLAEFHRGRGLSVLVVDVQDIYDEFNFGVVNPRAIKDFLENAHDTWPAPAPRWVLLVGDASWDFKNTTADDANYADWTYRSGEALQFVKNGSTPYAEGAELNHRNLVPTANYTTLEGHAASDTWFVCFDDGDTLPDMAIGRIPVVTPGELDGVVDKTIAFAGSAPVGPWRRNLLFIANESVSFQRRSDLIANELGARGYVSTTIYPHPSEPANEHHTRRIIEAFDDGLLAVHFIGHGGRYIWRTGPPDLEKNHDLFTLEHLDELAANERLPVVLSLTCYSAPFDHPTADSIGEKLLRIPGRGAIAVFAASWRNSPSSTMGSLLLDELTVPGATIGEAVMRAKRGFRSDVLVQTYNLLGDPAVPVAAPTHRLALAVDDGGVLRLSVGMPVPVVDGTMIADWVASDGSTLRQDRVPVRGSEFSISLDRGVVAGEPTGVRVYVWDDELGVDGIGWVGLAQEDDAGEDAPPGARPVAERSSEEEAP